MFQIMILSFDYLTLQIIFRQTSAKFHMFLVL